MELKYLLYLVAKPLEIKCRRSQSVILVLVVFENLFSFLNSIFIYKLVFIRNLFLSLFL